MGGAIANNVPLFTRLTVSVGPASWSCHNGSRCRDVKRLAWWVSLTFGLMWLVAAAFFIIVVTEVLGWPMTPLTTLDLAGILFNVFSAG